MELERIHVHQLSAICLSLLLVLPLTAPAAAQRPLVIQPLAYSRITLPNGLVVLFNEDHSAPLVATDVWYKVGAKDEAPGHSGLAHLCEHLMGEGSPNVPGTQKQLVQSVGGSSRHWAETFRDYTRYYETAPSNELETVLWMESDRMAAPLATITPEKLATARSIIRQERLQQRENPVYGLANGYTITELYSASNPYSHDALGPMEELDRATVDDARQFCLPYYVPSNAILSLSGDFSAASATKLVTKYFGSIKGGSAPAHPVVPMPRLPAEARYVLEDARGRLPVLRIVWPTVGFASRDKIALNALASTLASNRAGRLSRVLIDERQLATSVSADNYDDPLGGLFQIEVTPRPTASLTTIEQVVDSILAGLPQAPPTARELERFSNANTLMAVTMLQTRESRADTLAQGMMWAGNPVDYAEQVAIAAHLTPDEVLRVARTYLTPGRIVISMIPAGKRELVSKPDRPYTVLAPLPPRTAP
jgi:zinc protease